MLKTLLKKQLFELNYSFFYDQKKGQMRSKSSSAVLIALYVLLMVGVVGGMFAVFSAMVCSQLTEAGMGWLYFTIFSLMAVAMGVFGSVFNTYSGLYLAKDNDLLLSMPIPVRYLLIVRLAGVYLMGLMFSAMVLLPAIIVYLINAFSAAALIGSLLLMLAVSALVLVLSCILGWVVAKISLKLKHKSFITVIVSLVFFAAYYFVYFKATELLQGLVENAVAIGGSIKAAAYPLYLIGKMGEGDFAAAAIIVLCTAALVVLTMWVLAHSFIKIATASGATEKVKYKETAVKQQSISSALLRKEFMRFTSSPNYMLNCGLGVLMLPVAAVALLIKGRELTAMLTMLFPGNSGFIAILAAGAMCMLASMNDMTAPSVSLEGKSIWIAQSMPIEPWQSLRAKLEMHLLLTEIPLLFCGICAVAVLGASAAESAFVIILPLLYGLLFACIGLFADLKKPNLKWTNEIIPVKQSISAMFVIFGGWIYTIAVAGLYLLVGDIISSWLYMLIVSVLTAGASVLLLRWIRTKGAKIFASI